MRTFRYTLGLGLALALLLVAALTVQAQSGVPGTVLLDDYPGATDDDKLTAALADVKTKTYIPAISCSAAAPTPSPRPRPRSADLKSWVLQPAILTPSSPAATSTVSRYHHLRTFLRSYSEGNAIGQFY
jgi:hypothetical protein